MTLENFSDQFDLLYNNITSNQAPGLTEYEKSVFLTKAQDEIVKNYFTANSKGNTIGQGFDDSAKRQADFSVLMKTMNCQSSIVAGNADTIQYRYKIGSNPDTYLPTTGYYTINVSRLDPRSKVYVFPSDVFIVINEVLVYTKDSKSKYYQIIPLKYDEYTRLMSKPFKRPLKNQAWRLINSGSVTGSSYTKCVEIIASPDYDSTTADNNLTYNIRYIRKPSPIIVGNLDGLNIDGVEYDPTNPKQCELDPILHEDILQRAVELAKVAWTATGNDNAQLVLQAGQRSE